MPNLNNRSPNAETAKCALESISMAVNPISKPFKYQIYSPYCTVYDVWY
jgi:hypothetical protein